MKIVCFWWRKGRFIWLLFIDGGERAVSLISTLALVPQLTSVGLLDGNRAQMVLHVSW